MYVPDEVSCSVCCTLIYSVYYSIASTSLSTMHTSNVKLIVENDSCKVTLIHSYNYSSEVPAFDTPSYPKIIKEVAQINGTLVIILDNKKAANILNKCSCFA